MALTESSSYQADKEQRWRGVRLDHVTMRFVVLLIAIGLAFAGSVSAEDAGEGSSETNVRLVQEKLREAGLYLGEVDGAHSTELAAAIGRYQIRNGLPITGQLDAETSKALGAKPAVTKNAGGPDQSSETWRRLRKTDQQFPGKTVWRAPSVRANQTEIPAPSPPAATAAVASETEEPPSPPDAATSTPADNAQPASTLPIANSNKERLRDYVAAFVLAGLDPHVGSETDFFGVRVRYYDQGVLDREKIRKDLQHYAARWPDRHFWVDGDISIDPQRGNRVRVTFPLRYDLRNGSKHLSGKVNKTLVLQPAGDDFQIIAVNEQKVD